MVIIEIEENKPTRKIVEGVIKGLRIAIDQKHVDPDDLAAVNTFITQYMNALGHFRRPKTSTEFDDYMAKISVELAMDLTLNADGTYAVPKKK